MTINYSDSFGYLPLIDDLTQSTILSALVPSGLVADRGLHLADFQPAAIPGHINHTSRRGHVPLKIIIAVTAIPLILIF